MGEALVQALVFLGTALVAVPLAVRLGLGSVLGYLGAGLLIGPALGLVGSEAEGLRHLGEYGVVLMLFLVGLEVEPRALWALRRRLLGLGAAQVVLTAALLALGARWLGLPWPAALAVGMALALSSTAIVVQTLAEKRLLGTEGGRSAFAVLLAQDIAVIPILALLPLLAVGAGGGGARSLSLVEGLPPLAVTFLTLAAVAAVVLTGTFLTRPAFRFVGRARLREMDTGLALFIVVSIAVLMELVGLSPALGAFLAGVVLAGSEFRHELEGDLQPFKGLLLGLFFISVGAGVDTARLLAEPLPLLGLTAAVVAAKALVLLLVAALARREPAERWLLALSLAQGGEFGFVVASYALALGVIAEGVAQSLLLVIALSMLATPLLFRLTDLLARRRDAAPPEDPDIDAEGPAIVAGVGRFGQIVARLLGNAGVEAVLLDADLAVIETMAAFGNRVFLGDPTRPDVLHSAGLDRARVLVVALDDPEAALRLVALARRRRPDLRIVARAHDRVGAYALHRAGADEVVRELFAGSLRAGRLALEGLGLSPEAAEAAERTFAGHDREAMAELADLWEPGVELHDNPAYMARARELDEVLEAALIDRLSDPPSDAPEAPPSR